jgi:hypothetical protein
MLEVGFVIVDEVLPTPSVTLTLEGLTRANPEVQLVTLRAAGCVSG